MVITIKMDEGWAPARYHEGMPIYPLGQPFQFKIQLVHDGHQSLKLKDPRTDQALLLALRTPEDTEEIIFELNPSRVDVMGEITSPPTSSITLQPQESVERALPLTELCAAQCFAPGWFEARISLHDSTSPSFVFGIELRPESVPALVEFALDEMKDLWSREQALSFLQGLPSPMELKLVTEDTPVAAVVRETNKEQAARLLQAWPHESLEPQMQRFFEQHRLK
jgi:hypothetical protein